jgi:hypothetical protein
MEPIKIKLKKEIVLRRHVVILNLAFVVPITMTAEKSKTSLVYYLLRGAGKLLL